MVRSPSKSKKKRVNIPIHGHKEHNTAFLLAIGGLIINWANNESVFLAMLQTLIGGKQLTAAIVWFSSRTTEARLELVLRLCREQVTDEELIKDIKKATNHFKGFSRVRNFYCHANYEYDNELRLHNVSGATFSQDGPPLRFKQRPMDAARVNEITDATIKLATFNRELWALVIRLQDELGVQHVRLPQLLT